MKKIADKSKTVKPIYRARTTVEDNEKAVFLSKALVEAHAAVSVHIREITSTFYWEGSVDTMTEYEVDMICMDLQKVKQIIDNYHTYKLPEFLYWQIDASPKIKEWCKDWCEKGSK